jgi:hypothetical protein
MFNSNYEMFEALHERQLRLRQENQPKSILNKTMDTSLNLRPWNDPAITAPEAGDGVFLTSATYGLPIDGRRHLVVDGIAFGSAVCANIGQWNHHS